MSAARSACALALVFACSCAREATLYIAPPPGNAGSSIILIFGTSPEFVYAVAHPGNSERFTARVPHDLVPSTGLTALTFPCPLEALGIRPGILSVSGAGSGQLLPPSRKMFEASVGAAGGLSAWTAIDAPPSSVSTLHVDIPQLSCRSFDTRDVVIDLMGGRRISLGIAIDDERALLATYDGRFFIMTPDLAITQLTNTSSHTPHFAVFREPGGALWLFGAGKAARGSLEGGFVITSSLAFGHVTQFIRVDGPRDASTAFEMFLVDGAGTFHHFDGTTWTIVQGNVPAPDKSQRETVAWAGPNEGTATGVVSDGIVYDSQGTITDEQPDGVEATLAIAFLPGYGVISGGGTGQLHHRVDGHWANIGGALGSIHLVYALSSSVLFGGRFGVLEELDPRTDSCPPVNYGDDEIDLAFPFGPGRHVLISQERDGKEQVVLISRDPGPDLCFSADASP